MKKHILDKFNLFARTFLLIIFFVTSSGNVKADDGGIPQNPLRVHFIAVGYADAILIELPDSSTILIDAAERENVDLLLKYFSSRHINKIDYAMISHPHKNHFGGFFAITEKIPLGQVFINGDKNGEEGYPELLNLFKKCNIPVQRLKRGSKIKTSTSQIHITILNPSTLSGSTHDNAIVTWLRYDKTFFLFTSDISEKQQKALIDKYPFIQGANYVQVPHHGGLMDDKFARAFDRVTFIISTGQNQWGFPHKKELDKLKGKVLRTDVNGTIVLESDGQTVKIIKPTQ